MLDVGGGLGGPARLCAATHGCSVRGIDLTPEYIAAGNAISSWPAIAAATGGRVTLAVADALDMSAEVADGSVDAAYMLHVGMNIADKRGLAAEIFRALRSGGRFGVFDMMAGVGEGAALAFPLPFASYAQRPIPLLLAPVQLSVQPVDRSGCRRECAPCGRAQRNPSVPSADRRALCPFAAADQGRGGLRAGHGRRLPGGLCRGGV